MKTLTQEEKETIEARKRSGTNETLPKTNGWTNKPTWTVNLWLTNVEGTYHDLNGIISRALDLHQAADQLQEYVENLVFGERGEKVNGLAADLVGWSLAYVNWSEIVANNLEE